MERVGSIDKPRKEVCDSGVSRVVPCLGLERKDTRESRRSQVRSRLKRIGWGSRKFSDNRNGRVPKALGRSGGGRRQMKGHRMNMRARDVGVSSKRVSVGVKNRDCVVRESLSVQSVGVRDVSNLQSDVEPLAVRVAKDTDGAVESTVPRRLIHTLPRKCRPRNHGVKTRSMAAASRQWRTLNCRIIPIWSKSARDGGGPVCPGSRKRGPSGPIDMAPDGCPIMGKRSRADIMIP